MNIDEDKEFFKKKLHLKTKIFKDRSICHFNLMNSKYKIVLFTSGSGTNAERIFEYFKGHAFIQVVLLLSNNREAYALERAKKFDVPTKIFTRRICFPTFYLEENHRVSINNSSKRKIFLQKSMLTCRAI